MAEEPRYYPQLMAEDYNHWQLYREFQAISDVVERLKTRVDQLESIRESWGTMWSGETGGAHNQGLMSATTYTSALILNGWDEIQQGDNMRCSTVSSAIIVQTAGVYDVRFSSIVMRQTENHYLRIHTWVNDDYQSAIGTVVKSLNSSATAELQQAYFLGTVTLTTSDEISIRLWGNASATAIFYMQTLQVTKRSD